MSPFVTFLITAVLILVGVVICMIGYCWAKSIQVDYDEHQRGRIWFEAERELKEEIKKQKREEMRKSGTREEDFCNDSYGRIYNAIPQPISPDEAEIADMVYKRMEGTLKNIEKNTLNSSDGPMNVWKNSNFASNKK